VVSVPKGRKSSLPLFGMSTDGNLDYGYFC
jgi:hypothetical protein